MTSWNDEGVIQDLANLEPLAYEKVRLETAKKLRARVSVLDEEVAKRGFHSLMPEEAYQDRNFEFTRP